jgi:hypothetical protein
VWRTWKHGRKDRRKEECRRRCSVDGKLWKRHGVHRPLLSTDLSVIKRGSKKCVLYRHCCIQGGANVTWHSCVYMTSDVCNTLCNWVYLNIGTYVTKLYHVMSQKCAIFWGTGFKYWPTYRIYAFSSHAFLQSVQKNAGISQISRQPLPSTCCSIYLIYCHHSTIYSQTPIQHHHDWTPSETQVQKFPVILVQYLTLPSPLL